MEKNKNVRTKIVATLGPASSTNAVVGHMIREGMDVARLNLSHGNHDEHRARVGVVREEASLAERPVALLLDLQGPRLRVGSVEPGTVLKEGSRVQLDAETETGSDERIGISFAGKVASAVKNGHRILLADGTLELSVVEADPDKARLEALVVTGGPLASNKGVNLPDSRVELPPITDKDRRDLTFGLDLGVDYIALSFVGSADDVSRLRGLVQAAGADVPLVAKIEREDAVHRIEEIIEVSDAVMVARGDLALEIGAAAVPLVQKRIIRLANAAGVPVITATQMLDSMIRNPVPTRAETSDVANAILDGSDAVMLSGETAIGRHPVQSVVEMRVIAAEVEPGLAYERIGRRRAERSGTTMTLAVAEAAVDVARRLGVPGIIAATTTGHSARAVAKGRPEMLLAGATQDESVWRRLALVWGVTPLLVGPYADTDEMVAVVGTAAMDRGYLKAGDAFVVVSGQPVGRPGSTNMIQVRRVGDWEPSNAPPPTGES